MPPSSTPFFPQLRPILAPMGSRLRSGLESMRRDTLDQLERRFSHVLTPDFFPKPKSGIGSRECVYNPWRTFWAALSQAVTPGTPDRAIVRQFQALGVLTEQDPISSSDSTYCQARARLSIESLSNAVAATAKAAQRKVPKADAGFLQNRPLKALDGSSVTLYDSPKNRKAYPKVQSPKHQEASVFPVMRVLALFCLASGTLLSAITGSLRVSELALLPQLLGLFKARDIALGDRGFGHIVVLLLLQTIGVDFIGRPHRRVDGRKRIRRLGPNDWLMTWTKGRPSPIMPVHQWHLLPKSMTVRLIRGGYHRKGFRLRRVTLVTTLLDPTLYPSQDILLAYGRRWRLEMCLDDLKTTLGMEMLSWKSPAMVQKELQLHLIVHNLVRLVMADASSAHGPSIERMSFKGSLDAIKEFGKAFTQARSNKQRQQLHQELLRSIAQDLLPERPGRHEPRAVKRRKRKYPRLNAPRHQFKDPPKRHQRRKKARLLRKSCSNP